MKQDAIYARYSSHAQDDSTSIEVQIEQCERSAGGKCKHYIDRAKTGRSMGGRTAFLELLRDADAGKIARVFVYKFDRIGRDAETHVIARQLDEAGVALISATEGTNQLSRGIQLVVAEDYSRQLATRTRDGLIKRHEQGGFTGGVPTYGYHVVTRDGRRVLEVNPSEAGIVREIVNRYLNEAVGFKTIAKDLRQRGITSRRGVGWCFTSVRSLLLNPTLTGRIRYNARRMHLDRKTDRRVPRWKEKSDHHERHDERLRIIDDATFGKIQERLKLSSRKGHTRPGGRGVRAFTGLVFCQCGAKCHVVTSTNQKGSYTYYLCSRHTRLGDCPHANRIREDALIEEVQRRFQFIFQHRAKIIARATQIVREELNSGRDDAERLRADLAGVEAEQNRLMDLLMDQGISDVAKQTVNRRLTDAEQRRTRLLEAMQGFQDDAGADTKQLDRRIAEAFQDAQERLAAAETPELVNRFVEQFVGPMVIQEDGEVAQKESPATEVTGDSFGYIAGGRFEPKRVIRGAYWQTGSLAA